MLLCKCSLKKFVYPKYFHCKKLNRIPNHSVNLIRDRDLVLLPRGLVHRRHVENPVGVHVESDLYLGHTAGGRRNPTQVEFAQQMVVLGHRPLALVHLLKKKMFKCGG